MIKYRKLTDMKLQDIKVKDEHGEKVLKSMVVLTPEEFEELVSDVWQAAINRHEYENGDIADWSYVPTDKETYLNYIKDKIGIKK